VLALRGVRAPFLHAPARLSHLVAGTIKRLGGRSPTTRAAVTGLTTALLPCGWLYAFVAVAGGSGNAGTGALIMLLFWTGTLPVLVSIGWSLQRLAGPLRSRLPLVTAVAVALLGLLSMAGRMRPPAAPASDPAAGVHAHGPPQ
jgi:hypothetical protein